MVDPFKEHAMSQTPGILPIPDFEDGGKLHPTMLLWPIPNEVLIQIQASVEEDIKDRLRIERRYLRHEQKWRERKERSRKRREGSQAPPGSDTQP